MVGAPLVILRTRICCGKWRCERRRGSRNRRCRLPGDGCRSPQFSPATSGRRHREGRKRRQRGPRPRSQPWRARRRRDGDDDHAERSVEHSHGDWRQRRHGRSRRGGVPSRGVCPPLSHRRRRRRRGYIERDNFDCDGRRVGDRDFHWRGRGGWRRGRWRRPIRLQRRRGWSGNFNGRCVECDRLGVRDGDVHWWEGRRWWIRGWGSQWRERLGRSRLRCRVGCLDRKRAGLCECLRLRRRSRDPPTRGNERRRIVFRQRSQLIRQGDDDGVRSQRQPGERID